MAPKHPKNAPLSIEVIDSKIVISAGVETCAFAMEHLDSLTFDTNTGLQLPKSDRLKVVDPEAFAKDAVLLGFDREDIEKLFDLSLERAVEYGAAGVQIPAKFSLLVPKSSAEQEERRYNREPSSSEVRKHLEEVIDRVQALEQALRGLLLSRDSTWTGGHDWQEAVDHAADVLKDETVR